MPAAYGPAGQEVQNTLDWEPTVNHIPEEPESPRPRFSLFWRLMALVTIVSLLSLALSMSVFWLNRIWPLPLLLWESRELTNTAPMPQVNPALVHLEGDQGRGGSGFNVCPEGRVVTTLHTLEGAREARVSFADGAVYSSRFWEEEPLLDLALLYLDGVQGELPTLEVSSEPMQTGYTALVAGYPFTLTRLVQRGKVTDIRDSRQGAAPVLVIDLPVFPGQSGSPVLDMQGRVRAMVFAGSRTESDRPPRTLAVPASVFKPMVTASLDQVNQP